MSKTKLYNLDRVDRDKVKVKIKGIDYEVNEPTLEDFIKIQKLDFVENTDEALEQLAGIIAPKVKLEELTGQMRELFFKLCFKVLSGESGAEKKVDTGGGPAGIEDGVETKINIFFLIGKFMSNFNYKFDEVLKMNWFIFNDLLTAINIIKAGESLNNLRIAENHLKLKSEKTAKKYVNIYNELEKVFKKGVEVDETEKYKNQLADIMKNGRI